MRSRKLLAVLAETGETHAQTGMERAEAFKKVLNVLAIKRRADKTAIVVRLNGATVLFPLGELPIIAIATPLKGM